MKNWLIIVLGIILFSSCGRGAEKPVTLYLSNHGTKMFDNAFFMVEINNDIVFSDSVKNEYLSHHWTDKELILLKEKLDLSVRVSVNKHVLEKDTSVLLTGSDSVQLFILFEFTPYNKRYNNPDIYRFIEGEVDNYSFVDLADSLYNSGALSNADEFLNDTIPPLNSLSINIK